MSWKLPQTARCHPCQVAQRGGEFPWGWRCLGSLLVSRNEWVMPQHHLSLPPGACACRSRPRATTGLFSIPPSSHLCSPGTSILSSPLSSRYLFASEALVGSPWITLPPLPWPSSLSLLQPPPRAAASLPWVLLGWCHVDPAPPRVASSFSQASPLVHSPAACSAAVIVPVLQALISPPHLCNSTAACSARPRQPGLAPRSYPPPSPSPRLRLFFWCSEPRRRGIFFQNDFLLLHAPGWGWLSRGNVV